MHGLIKVPPLQPTHTTLPAAAEVTLVSSVEQNGRTAACPGEVVTFTCTVTQGASLNWASTAFTSCDSTLFALTLQLVAPVSVAVSKPTSQPLLTSLKLDNPFRQT